MTTRMPDCYACKNRQNLDAEPPTCRAFPSGIPQEIFYDGEPHTRSRAGDGGIVFERDDSVDEG